MDYPGMNVSPARRPARFLAWAGSAVLGLLLLAPYTHAQNVALLAALEPREATAGSVVRVRGQGLGESAAGRRIQLVQDGARHELVVLAWSAHEIGARLPADLPPGRYALVLADASGRALAGRALVLDVIAPRPVAVHLAVKFFCDTDVLAHPDTILVQFAREDEGQLVSATLRHAGMSRGPFGQRRHHYRGEAQLLPGAYQLGVATPASQFAVRDWRAVAPPGYSDSHDCAAHRRVAGGGALPAAPQAIVVPALRLHQSVSSHATLIDVETLTQTAP